MELLVGCGNSREKRISADSGKAFWTQLVTLDDYAGCSPDVVHDLNVLPYPFASDQFDEVHAYCVLEHCGRQGDAEFFFSQWMEFWRILKPGGLFMGICPHHTSPWAWGDPSHTRIIGLEQLTFLSQKAYEQVGMSSMSDFRRMWKGDFELVWQQLMPENRLQHFVLKALK